MGIIRPATDLSLEDAKEITYDFSLISATGEELQFSELKGKVVFMNFWATWCQPCIAEMPDIDELYKSIPGENIVFVMVSVDKEFSRAKKLLGKKGFSFPIYQVNSQLPAEFSSRSIPTTFVISKDGKIAVRETGIASYNTKEFREYLLALAGA